MKKTILAMIALGISALLPVMHAAEKGAEPVVISHGAKVTLTEHLVVGDITVFDFSSKYCPPCMALSPKLDMLHAKIPNLAVVKVDINRPSAKGIDWKSPVAQQYKLHSIPHIKIYDADGKLVAEGDKAMNLIQGAISLLSGKYGFIPKFQQLQLKEGNDGPSFYFHDEGKNENQAALPSTQNPPKFKNADANEYVKDYSDYANEFVTACKGNDVDKINALTAEMQDWSTKGSAILNNLKGPAVQKFQDWHTEITSEIQAAVAKELNKFQNGAKVKGGKKRASPPPANVEN